MKKGKDCSESVRKESELFLFGFSPIDNMETVMLQLLSKKWIITVIIINVSLTDGTNCLNGRTFNPECPSEENVFLYFKT